MHRIAENGGVFLEGDEAAGTLGTAVPAASLQSFQDELAGFVEDTGQVLSPTDNAQVRKGLQTNRLVSSDAGGTADAITGSYTPVITSLTHNMVLCVRAASANATISPTFTPNFGVIVPSGMYKGANVSLAIGDITGAGHGLKLRWDAILTKWELLNPAPGIVANKSVAYPKIQDVSASQKGLGRKTAGAGTIEECSISEMLEWLGICAQGDFVYRGALGWSRIAAGPANYFMQTKGVGADPVWSPVNIPVASVFGRTGAVAMTAADVAAALGYMPVPVDAANGGIGVGCTWATWVATAYTPGSVYALNGQSRCISCVAIYTQNFSLFQRIS